MKSGQFTIPYSTSYPGLSFNNQLNILEVIGDWGIMSNQNHKMMTTAGSFSDAPDSLFNGDYLFEVVYSENVGTLIFSGHGHGGSIQVYIITQNSNWNKIESSDKYLNSFENPASSSDHHNFGVVEHGDKIYLVGVYLGGSQNTIQVVNFLNVGTIEEARTRDWILIGKLKNAVYRPAVIYSNEQLLVVGYTGSSSNCQDVQYLNLASNTSGVYKGTIDCGVYSGHYYPGMYNTPGGNVSMFGGQKATKSCIQQTKSSEDLDTKWTCISSSDSSLEGLVYPYSNYDGGARLRYVNFVL